MGSPQLYLGRDSAGDYFGGAFDVVELRRDFIGASGVQSRYNLDSTNDGLPDWWAWRYFGTLSLNPNSLAPCGNGLTILQCFQQGVSPIDYYNGATPIIVKTNGDDQNGVPYGFLSQGLTVLVTDANQNPLINAPVTFNVSSGGGNVAPAASGTTRCTSLVVRTGTDGQATAYYQDGDAAGRPSQIQAVAGNNSSVFTSTELPLVAEWDFDDGEGTVAADTSNTGNPLNLNAGVAWSVGYDGNGSVTLDGSTGYLATGPSPTLTTTGSSPLSIGVWIQIPQNLAFGSANAIYPVIEFSDTNSDSITLQLRGGGHGIEAVLKSGTAQSVIDGAINPSAITDGNWHYVGFSYNGKGTLFITLDGGQLVSQSGVKLPSVNTPVVSLGRDQSGDYFDGSLDDTQILQEAFTQSMFQDNFMADEFNVVQRISGAAFQTSSGTWIDTGTGAVDTGRRGSVNYTFHVPADGIWAFQLTVQPVGDVKWKNITIPFEILIDGVPVGQYDLVSYNGAAETITGLTQFLPEGNHTFQIVDLNYSGVNDLEIDSIEILQPKGADELIGGQPDWVTQKIEAADTVQPVAGTSYVSPICVEGSARFTQQVWIASGTQASVTIQPEVNGQWYANVPLNGDGSVTNVVTNFEEGMLSSTSSVIWAPFNVAANTVAPFMIRQGDSLRLTGYPVGNQSGGPLAITIASGTSMVSGSTIYTGTTTANVPLNYAFATSGTYTVQTVWNGTSTSTAQIQVETANFGNMLYAYVDNPLTWNLPGVGANLPIDWDDNLSVTANSPPAAVGQSVQILPIASGTLYGVARLNPGGPIVGEGAVLSSNLYNASQTGDTYVSGTAADGIPIVHSSIVINAIPPGGTVVIQIVIAGATFDDGTTKRTLTRRRISSTVSIISTSTGPIPTVSATTSISMTPAEILWARCFNLDRMSLNSTLI